MAVRKVTKEAAIAEHGVRYAHVGDWDDPIREVLGSAVPGIPFHWESESACRYAVRRKAAGNIPERLRAIDAELRRPLSLVLAVAGLLKFRSASIARVRTLWAERQRLSRINVPTWFPEVKRLPAMVRIPVPIPFGTSVFRLRVSLDEGEMAIDELPVVSREVWGAGSDNGTWDYVIRYTLGNQLEFEYNRPNFAVREVSCGIEGWRLFLDKAAAEAAQKEMLIAAVRSAHHLFR